MMKKLDWKLHIRVYRFDYLSRLSSAGWFTKHLWIDLWKYSISVKLG